MAEEVRTPFEVLQAKMAEIANMESGGFIDKQTAVRQRELAWATSRHQCGMRIRVVATQ